MARRKLSRLLFFGTPDFAVPTLEKLCTAGRTPVLVVAQPSRPAGRGKKLKDPPVIARARALGLEVEQPEEIAAPEFLKRLKTLRPDVAVVVAYGRLFPPELLGLPRAGCINLHASLLPRYRGASPVQAALLAGDRTTGVTTMQMVEALDAGPILLQEETEIQPWERADTLGERLAELGADLVVRTLEGLEAGKLTPRKQREESASYCPRLTKQQGKVNWELSAQEIHNRLRAFTPWPGLWAYLKGRRLKILGAKPIDWEQVPSGRSGTFLGLRQGRLAILCGGDSILGLELVQRPGRKALGAQEFANGERLRVGQPFV